jgi:hypothetical protein
MADAELTATYGMTNGKLPEEVVLRQAEIANPRFTPRELRLIREHAGVSLSEMLADEKSDEKFVVFGWLKLRRMGYEVDWEAMDDIVLSFDMGDAPVDPTSGRPPTTLPSSAGTGA